MARLNGSAPRLALAFFGWLIAAVLLGSQHGCAPAGQSASAAQSNLDAPAAGGSSPSAKSGPSADQLLFPSATDASAALIAAAKDKNTDQLRKILGPARDELVSGDPVQDANNLDSFARHAGEADRLEQVSDQKAIVHIGKKDWPFPIPIEKDASGRWYFDTAAGKDEILNRRIGDDELTTIEVVRAYVDAQREYASKDRMGDSVLQYAQKITSTPGKHDGLYWPAAEGEEQSPFGSLVADAQVQGYGAKLGSGRRPYHGYFYRILTKQGPHTPAGAYSYIINGRMIAGFALVAYPAQYGNTGIMTFIVNHDGKVYQKDLGPNTATIASKIDTYDPDGTWTLVQ
ncbi:MAG TPA: DUF2950 domain-containing protein [Tepidisphaeraceae bacterium]|nr:DUF2950 domain-containing protein [Tepidisphaeraceae bacterium]